MEEGASMEEAATGKAAVDSAAVVEEPSSKRQRGSDSCQTGMGRQREVGPGMGAGGEGTVRMKCISFREGPHRRAEILPQGRNFAAPGRTGVE